MASWRHCQHEYFARALARPSFFSRNLSKRRKHVFIIEYVIYGGIIQSFNRNQNTLAHLFTMALSLDYKVPGVSVAFIKHLLHIVYNRPFKFKNISYQFSCASCASQLPQCQSTQNSPQGPYNETPTETLLLEQRVGFGWRGWRASL